VDFKSTQFQVSCLIPLVASAKMISGIVFDKVFNGRRALPLLFCIFSGGVILAAAQFR
jgi:hypothetical protein